MVKSLIVGGLGFIGCHLAEESLKRGHEVTVLSRSLKKASNIRAIADRVSTISLDLKDITSEVEGFDYIFDLAGSTDNYAIVEGQPTRDIEMNCVPTISLLEAIRKRNPEARLMFASTFFVNGRPQALPVNSNTPCNPLGLYGATKLASEHFCHVYHNVFGVKPIILRFCNVFGPREQASKQKAGFNYMIQQATLGNPIGLYDNGNFYRDYIYVTDVASACLSIAEKGDIDATYYVGRGEYVKFKDLADIIAQETGVKIEPISPPDFHRRVGIKDFVSDPSPLKQMGWEPKVSLKEGIRRTIAYYK